MCLCVCVGGGVGADRHMCNMHVHVQHTCASVHAHTEQAGQPAYVISVLRCVRTQPQPCLNQNVCLAMLVLNAPLGAVRHSAIDDEALQLRQLLLTAADGAAEQAGVCVYGCIKGKGVLQGVHTYHSMTSTYMCACFTERRSEEGGTDTAGRHIQHHVLHVHPHKQMPQAPQAAVGQVVSGACSRLHCGVAFAHRTMMFSNSLESEIIASTSPQVICSLRRSLNTRMD